MIVAGAGDAGAQQALPLVDRAQDRRAEHEELQVVVRVRARAEQVVPFVVAHRPVEVLARSVDAGERLLVQQAREAVLRRRPLHRLHRHHLMIGGEVGVLEHRGDFVLARRHFVVPGLHRHADFVELGLDVRHERHRPVGDRAEVLIFQLLPLRRLGAEQRAAGVDEIGTRQVEVLIDQEIFLLGPARRDDARRGRAEQLQHADRLLRQRFHRAQQRRLLVERLAGPADEGRRDHQRDGAAAVQQPRRARRIPRRVAARLEGGAHAARREARRVGLALDQFLARELEDRFAVAGRRQKRVVLLGGDAGERLEPVRVVRRAVLDRPVLHRARDFVGDRQIERFAVGDGPAQRLVHRLRQPRLLHLVVEHQAAERSVVPAGAVRVRRACFLGCGYRPVADGADCFAENCRTHDVALPLVDRISVRQEVGIMCRLFATRAIGHSRQKCRQSPESSHKCREIAGRAARDAPLRDHHSHSSRELTGLAMNVLGCQPSSARNSASTIAVAPQISKRPARRAGTTMRCPSRSRSVVASRS